MKAALISLGSTSSKWIAQAMRNYFARVDELNLKKFEVFIGPNEKIFYDGEPMKNYDCVYARGSGKHVNLLKSITSLIKEQTYVPLRSKSFSLGHDKLLSHLQFAAKGIPTPKTFLASTPEAGKKILDRINYPVVLKIPAGTHGKGVMFADSKESASSMIDALAVLRQPVLMQEFIDTDGVDTRAIVVGEKVVAAMKRKAVKGEQRANVHLGGKVEPTEVDEITEKISVDAAHALGCDVCAVDLLLGPKGPMVLEVNVSPGIQGITQATGKDVADLIAKYLINKTKAIKTQKKNNTVKQLVQSTEIIAPLDFRGTRILLPSFVNETFKGREKEEIVFDCSRNKIVMMRQK